MRDAIATKRSRRLMLVAVGLLAAVAVLPLLVPPSALSFPAGFGGHGAQLREGLWGERVQGGLRSRGGDGACGRPPPPGCGRP